MPAGMTGGKPVAPDHCNPPEVIAFCNGRGSPQAGRWRLRPGMAPQSDSCFTSLFQSVGKRVSVVGGALAACWHLSCITFGSTAKRGFR